MNTSQKILAGALLLIFAAPLIFAESFDVISVNYSPAPTAPGDLVTVYVTAKNTTNAASGPVSITIKPEYPFSLSESGKSEQSFATVLPQQSVLAILEIQVDGAALNGTYSLDVQAKSRDLVGVGRPA